MVKSAPRAAPRSCIGVDLGGTKMLVGVVDSERRVGYRASAASAGLSRDELLATLERELRAAIEARPDVQAAGLGIPCTIDRRRGVAVIAVNLDLADVPVGELMSERVGLPVFVDNDANAAILAEHRFGAAHGTRNAVMLTIGTGIGGGLVIDGRVYRGSSGAGAELGHIVIDAEGPRCQGNCPNRGCVEALASGTAIAREGIAAAQRAPDSALGRALAQGEEVDGRRVTDAALAGDATARDVLQLIGRRIGVALSSLANAFDPDVIVLGGGASRAGDLLTGPARAELAARALPPMNRTPVTAAELGPDAGMIGAATMALLELTGGSPG
ncbi:MAG TPA: ROK family protein [Solirubrobacterales bacterium]|nr:ROK family protein [Solirubrobacterales bacterium]